MIESICESIANHSPFPPSEVKAAYDLCKSFDLILMAVNLAQETGAGSPLRNIVSSLMRIKKGTWNENP